MLVTSTMGNYLKNIGLQQKWQKRKEDMHLTAGRKIVIKPAAGSKSDVYTAAVENFMKEQEELRSKIKSLLRENSECSRASVEFKLQYGGKISPREMEYIKNNCPDLYAKAVEREKERQEYAAQLRNCKSKDELFALRIGKLSSLMGECQAAESRGDYGASFELRARLYNIEEEHNEYIKSDEYQELCRKEKTEKEAAEAKVKEKKAEESQEENANKDEGVKASDEEELPTEENAPGQGQELSGTNPDAAKDKEKSDAASHSLRTEKRHESPPHRVKTPIKSVADKYQKSKPVTVKETVDVRCAAPLNSGPDMPENAVEEIKGNLSINI